MLTYSHVNAKTVEMIRENFHCAKGRNFITYSAARAELEDTGYRPFVEARQRTGLLVRTA